MLILNVSLTVPSSRMELNFEPRSSVLSYVRGRKRDRVQRSNERGVNRGQEML